jgi:hypothetical protein
VNYTGPPTLHGQLLSQLREGLGVNCRVHVWENVVLPSSGSFGEVSGGGFGAAAAEGQEGLGGRQRRRGGRLRDVVIGVQLGVCVAGGWWCGWMMGGRLGGMRRPKHGLRKRDLVGN